MELSRAPGSRMHGRVPLIAATRNGEKLALLSQLAGQSHALEPLPPGLEPVEAEGQASPEAGALVGNAISKAVSASRALGGARTIASDGGLLIPGLGAAWQPARTRRFVGPEATNRERAVALLRLARDLLGSQRRIGWREIVAVAEDGEVIATFTAEATPGWLTQSLPAGWDDDGQTFWVPQLWLNEQGNSTVAPGGAADHWDRLALLVAPFLDGLALRVAR